MGEWMKCDAFAFCVYVGAAMGWGIIIGLLFGWPL